MRDEEIDAFIHSFGGHASADEERLRAMMDYAESARCRVQFLREYFGELPGKRCGQCDNCCRPLEVAGGVNAAAIGPDASCVGDNASRFGDDASRFGADTAALGATGRPLATEPVDAARIGAKKVGNGIPAGPEPPQYRARQSVRHARFGTGEVIDCTGDEIEVAFVRYGHRRVLASYLRPVP